MYVEVRNDLYSDGIGVTHSFATFRAAHKLLVVHIMLDINKVQGSP